MRMGGNIHLAVSGVWVTPQHKPPSEQKWLLTLKGHRIHSERRRWWASAVAMRPAGVAEVIVCSTNQTFLSFPESWRACSLKFKWRSRSEGWTGRHRAVTPWRTFLASGSAVSKQPPAFSFLQVSPLMQSETHPRALPSWDGFHPVADCGAALRSGPFQPVRLGRALYAAEHPGGDDLSGCVGSASRLDFSFSPNFHSIDP